MVPQMSTTNVTAPEQTESIDVIDGGEAVVVVRDGVTRRFPSRWLRLLVSGTGNVDPASGHRLFDSVSLPSEFKVRSATYLEESGQWEIRFEGETRGTPIDLERLLVSTVIEEIDGPERTPFSSADPPSRAVDYEMLEAPAALRSFLDTLLRRGYARVRDVPRSSTELERFTRRLRLEQGLLPPGCFEEAFSGDRDGDDPSSLHASVHTDSPYRDPVPAFHLRLCLESSGKGGEMIVADGMSIAATLATEEPFAAVELARWPMLFARQGAKDDLRRAVPMLEMTQDGGLQRITFNDRAAVDFTCPDDRLPVCAGAYDTLARIVQREGLQNRFRVQPGDLLIVDNERVLHGHLPLIGSGSQRHACGYVGRGDLMSTWRRARSGLLD